MNETERFEYATEKLLGWLQAVQDIAQQHGKPLEGHEYGRFLGYPLWMRLVYCGTAPTQYLLEYAGRMSSVPVEQVRLGVEALTHKLLSDLIFVATVQNLPTREDRLLWLETHPEWSRLIGRLVLEIGPIGQKRDFSG